MKARRCLWRRRGGRETEGDREKEAEWGRCLMSGLSVSMVGILLQGVTVGRSGRIFLFNTKRGAPSDLGWRFSGRGKGGCICLAHIFVDGSQRKCHDSHQGRQPGQEETTVRRSTLHWAGEIDVGPRSLLLVSEASQRPALLVPDVWLTSLEAGGRVPL